MHVNLRTMTPLVAAYILWFAPCESIAQQMPTVEQILAKWEERQKKVVSAKFWWDEETTRPKDSISRILRMARALKDPNAIYPPQDHTFVKPVYVSFDGDKLRYEYDLLDWREKMNESHHVFTFDGKNGKNFSTGGGTGIPHGSERTEKRHTEVTNLHIRAILMTYRPLHPKMSPCLNSSYSLTGRRATIQGSECYELLAMRNNTAVTTKLWVDPGKDFVPVRHTVTANFVEVARLDVSFVPHGDVGWAPASWSLVHRDADGSLSLSVRATVTRNEINVKIDHAEFDPEFPVGTFVFTDKTRDGYIQKENGEKRMVSTAEMARPYEELLNTPSSSRFRRLLSWPFLVSGVTLVLSAVVIAFVWQKRRKRTIA